MALGLGEQEEAGGGGMRVGAIDLGSNTVRLIVADVDDQGLRPLARELATPRLGQGLSPGQRLRPAARREASRAVKDFTATARRMGASKIVLGATQACRIASDGQQFVNQLQEELGLDWAVVLSPEEEAALAREGVKAVLEGPRRGAWVADVGGGSTELVALEGRVEAVSLGVGAVVITQEWLTAEPPSAAQIQGAMGQVVAMARDNGPREVGRLIVTGGTAATVASILQGLDTYKPEALDNYRVGVGRVWWMLLWLGGMELSRRRRLRGMIEPRRAEVIVGGLVVVAGLVRAFGVEEITTMNAGLLEGLALAAGKESGNAGDSPCPDL